jgi:TPP-dependent pyruvate/acetoin dehydrogenase alpha subunit
MHIADFTVGHLGANAIVGGGTPIATGAANFLSHIAMRCFFSTVFTC